jgi:hypothetical protein
MDNINLDLDTKLNKCALDLVSYSIAGFIVGVGICPLFKNKR